MFLDRLEKITKLNDFFFQLLFFQKYIVNFLAQKSWP